MRIRQWVPAVLALALFGCSGGSGGTAVSTGLLPAPSVVATGATVVGKLDLGGSIGGAAITAVDASGRVLAQATSDATGNFWLQGNFPADFRVTAQLGGSTPSFATEVRGYDPAGQFFARINVPTTLASLYLQSHPGLSWSDAQGRVKQALSIPDGLDLASGIEESPRNPFSHIAFWRQAALNGGWSKYSATVLQQMDQGASLAFVLTQDQLSSPITGLEPGIQAEAERIRTFLAQYLVYSSESLAFNPAAHQLPTLGQARVLAAGPSAGGWGPVGPVSALGQFILGTATGVTGNIITGVTKGLITWATGQMSLNSGTTQQLAQILTIVQNVETEVDSINATLTQQQYQAYQQSLYSNTTIVTAALGSAAGSADQSFGNSSIGMVTNGNTLLYNLNQSVKQGLTNLPFVPTAGVAALVNSTLTNNNLTNAVGNIQNYMLGPLNPNTGINPSMPVLSQNLILGGLGMDTPASVQGVPWRANNLIDQTLQTYSYYSGYQALGLYLLGENSHTYNNSTTPSSQMTLAAQNVFLGAQSLKQQRGQQPIYVPSDHLLVDLECGVMWYFEMQSAKSYADAQKFARNLSVSGTLPDGSTVTFKDWRLPTYCEMLSLQARGTYNPTPYASPAPNASPTPQIPVNSHKAYPDYGQATAGLPSLGFQNVATALNSNSGSKATDGDLWMLFYNLVLDDKKNPLRITPSENRVFRLNHGSTSDNTDSLDSSDSVAFVVCRTLGTPNPPSVVLCPYYEVDEQLQQFPPEIARLYYCDLETSVPSPGAMFPADVAPTGLHPAEYLAYGLLDPPTPPTAQPAVQPSPFLETLYPTPSPVAVTITLPEKSLQCATTLTGKIHLGGTMTVGSLNMGASKTYKLNSVLASSSQPVSTLTEGRPNDLSRLVIFNSWKPGDLLSLNVEVLDGLVLPYTTNAADVTVSVAGQSATASLTAPDITPHSLGSILITPRNRVFGAGTSGIGTTFKTPIYCTGFYADQSVGEVGNTTTWAVTPSNSGVSIFSDGSQMILQVVQPAKGPIQTFTINATNQGQADSTQIQVQPVQVTP